MTLAQQIKNDAPLFVDDAEFGERIIYVPRGAAAREISALVDPTFDVESGAIVDTTQSLVLLADGVTIDPATNLPIGIPEPRSGDGCIVRGRICRVASHVRNTEDGLHDLTIEVGAPLPVAPIAAIADTDQTTDVVAAILDATIVAGQALALVIHTRDATIGDHAIASVLWSASQPFVERVFAFEDTAATKLRTSIWTLANPTPGANFVTVQFTSTPQRAIIGLFVISEADVDDLFETGAAMTLPLVGPGTDVPIEIDVQPGQLILFAATCVHPNSEVNDATIPAEHAGIQAYEIDFSPAASVGGDAFTSTHSAINGGFVRMGVEHLTGGNKGYAACAVALKPRQIAPS